MPLIRPGSILVAKLMFDVLGHSWSIDEKFNFCVVDHNILDDITMSYQGSLHDEWGLLDSDLPKAFVKACKKLRQTVCTDFQSYNESCGADLIKTKECR